MNAAGPVIRARYLENEDYCLAAWDRNPKKSKTWIHLLIVFPIVGLIVLPGTFKDPARGDPMWWVKPAVFVFVAMLAAWWSSPKFHRRQFQKNVRRLLASPPTEAWFEFSDAGFLSTGRDGRSGFHPWNTVPKVKQLADGLLIYFDEQHYFWVPQQAFANAEDYGAVVNLSQTKAKVFQPAKG